MFLSCKLSTQNVSSIRGSASFQGGQKPPCHRDSRPLSAPDPGASTHPEVTVPHAALSQHMGPSPCLSMIPWVMLAGNCKKKKTTCVCKYKSSPVESSGRNGLGEFASQEPRRLTAGPTLTPVCGPHKQGLGY